MGRIGREDMQSRHRDAQHTLALFSRCSEMGFPSSIDSSADSGRRWKVALWVSLLGTVSAAH